MRRHLGGLIKQSRSILRSTSVGGSSVEPSTVSHAAAAFTVEVSGTRTLLSSLTPRCTASGGAGKVCLILLKAERNTGSFWRPLTTGGTVQSFSQKRKSQRGVSSQGKQSSMDELLSSIEKDGEGFKEADVVSVWQQLADGAEGMAQEDRESHIHKAKGFQTLVDMSIMGTKRFSTEQLANIVMNAGQLGFDDDMLLDRISQNFMTRMSQVDPAELVNLATGLSLADHSPSVILFDAIQKRAVELASKFSPDQKTALEKAFKSFDYDHKDISSSL